MRYVSRYLIIVLALFFLLPGLQSISIASGPNSKQLIDFSRESIDKQWISVNDTVMGGVSKGGFRSTVDNTLEFSGTLSLENNGGFASIRTQATDWNLDGYDSIGLRLKGDGRTYYFNLMTSSRSAASSYRAPVKTQKNTWQDIRIPLNKFVYTSFGRVITTAIPLKAKDIQRLGFTLSDKKSGPFQLEISEIRAEKSGANSEADDSMDIVETATAAGSFKTLITAVKAAGLVDSLKGEGPLTVFAPNDEAFDRLTEGMVDNLLKPENKDKLTAILSYHVVPGEILLGNQSPETLLGKPVNIKTAGSFVINGAKVIESDILTSNGVIHIIDSVLLPPEEKLTPRQAAIEVIELAIRRGVPLFNAGQPSACAAVYEVAADSLLKSHSNALDDRSRLTLQKTLSEVQEDDPYEKAWALRRSLDAVYQSLKEN